MLLSKAQKALLDMLRRVGTMREEAARRLLLMAYPHTSGSRLSTSWNAWGRSGACMA